MREDFFDIIKEALRVKLAYRGTHFGVCSIMNVKSGACSEDCAYCAQSRYHRTNAPIYPIKSEEEVLIHAEHAQEIGARRFSLVASGRGPTRKEVETIARLVEKIRANTDLLPCASLGIVGVEDLMILKEAGLVRYHHNIETSRDYFPRICTTHSFEERIETLKAIKSAGLELCSGCILGLGETESDRLSIAKTLAEVGVDSVPINIYVPIEGTRLAPLGSRISPVDVIKTIAHFRISLKRPAIRLCGGRENALMDFQALSFMAGADAIMVGGYLTTPGRDPSLDQRLIQEIIRLWNSFETDLEKEVP